ncbi:MAG: M1 family metallopeptidase [Gemmatimonadetes bacterium]|nr:M1 family metallopeptidase [Gemmatimonadota bacterium]
MTHVRSAVGSLFALGVLLGFTGDAVAQSWLHPDEEGRTNQSIFRAIDEWPDANRYRAASGAPGPAYWQQQVDYVIETTLDTVEHVVSGSERIAYHNNSPDVLDYLWVQLDQNVRSLEHSRAYQTRRALPEEISERARRFLGVTQFDGGHDIARVQFVSGGDLLDADYRINGTLMKVNLLEPLEPGGAIELEIDWSFRVPDWGRGGKEQVSDGWIYELAQWFPRLAVYDDVNGWQTDQFLGRGEFYLEFGDYDVRINVPANHIVEATGVLQNPDDVLTETQRERLDRAYQGQTPVYIVGPDEVMTAGSRPVQDGMLTWHYKADDVRDFAWASSKTFVWDAAGYRYHENQEPIAVHSLYPRDAMPLWNEISTPAVIQTLETYGRMAFEYPYPKASNVNGPAGGMEYPMLAFCGARPREGREISDGLRWALMGVTIHEVGHNWFPMIVNSDERKWTWMDEGLNTFLQHYAEVEMDPDFGWWRSSPSGITEYMRDLDQVPIMTYSDLIHKDFGNNGYAKPAAGLSILRETVLGPEAFDDAFSGYAKRWMFKKPQPADFFRSLDEGAGEDMAWMWRGWFYTTHANDQAVADVGRQDAQELLGSTDQGPFYYRVRIVNEGGLVMPIIMDVEYESGRTQRVDLPVDVWRYNEKEFLYGFFAEEPVVRVLLDPDEELADIDTDNNLWLAPTS